MNQKDESMKPLQHIAWVTNWVNGLGWQFLNKGKAELRKSGERAVSKPVARKRNTARTYD